MSLKISYPVTIRLWMEDEAELWKRLKEANYQEPRPRSDGMLVRAVIQHVLSFGLVRNPVEGSSLQSGTSKENPSTARESSSESSYIDPQTQP